MVHLWGSDDNIGELLLLPSCGPQGLNSCVQGMAEGTFMPIIKIKLFQMVLRYQNISTCMYVHVYMWDLCMHIGSTVLTIHLFFFFF